MMTGRCRAACLLVAFLAAVPAASAAVTKGAEDYALAACLTQQPAGPLRDEGYSLGSIVTNGAGVSPLALGAVREAVLRELKRRPMTTVHVDAPVARSDRPAPLAHCLAIARSPAVRQAIARAGRRG